MPRQAIIDAPGALQHVIIKEIEQSKIFRDDEDREEFLRRLGKLVQQTETKCYAWALIEAVSCGKEGLLMAMNPGKSSQILSFRRSILEPRVKNDLSLSKFF
ncbi:MAG: hypothetical protein ABSE95_09920 [Thermodesulfobacteriota bacterium]